MSGFVPVDSFKIVYHGEPDGGNSKIGWTSLGAEIYQFFESFSL
jgi:hypothetical protein